MKYCLIEGFLLLFIRLLWLWKSFVWFMTRATLHAYSLGTWQNMVVHVSNSKVYQTLMNVLSKCNRVNEALKLLEEMFLMCCTCLMLRLNFNIIIHWLYKVKRSGKQRIDWLNASSWFKLSLVTYEVMIHGIMHI